MILHPARIRASTSTVAGAVVLVCAVLGTAAVISGHKQLLAQSGLAAEYRAGSGWEGPPTLTTIDNGLSADLVRQRSRERGGSAFTAIWRGYLIAPKRDRYRFATLGDDRAWLEIDKRPIVEAGDKWREQAVELARGLHPITIRYYDGGGRQAFDLQWAQGDHTHIDIPRLFLVPRLIDAGEVQRRIRMAALASAVPLAWSTIVVGILAGLIVWRCTLDPRTDRRMTTEMTAIYLIAAIAFTVGLTWGLPDFRGWAVDEITPGEVQDFVDLKFGGGWATTYPPLHFAVLAAASTPVYAAVSMAVVDSGLETYSGLFLIGRILSVGMALSMLALIYRLTRDECGHRAAKFAVMLTGLILPLPYYAKTANLDVPYLFWLVASWLFYLRAFRTGGLSSFCLFALTAAAAIATKDQAYGFYVLPAIQMIVIAIRRSRPLEAAATAPTPRTLLAMAGVFAVALTILFNVPFNWSGVREHLRVIVGPGSQPYRMYQADAGGYVRMFGDSILQMGNAMSWPLFFFGILGVVDAIRASAGSIRRLMLSAISYYLTFVAVVMYQYDRFFLGICIVLAIAAGRWLDRWTVPSKPFRRLRLAAAGLAIAYAAMRVAALDTMMLVDSRYFVERWVIARSRPDTQIAAEGTAFYLPRQTQLLWTRIHPDVALLETRKPDFLLINAGYEARTSDGPVPNEFYESLNRGDGHYRRVLRYRTELPLSPLQWEPRFNGTGDDPFSNLTKINPVIEVFERIETGMPRN